MTSFWGWKIFWGSLIETVWDKKNFWGLLMKTFWENTAQKLCK